MLTNRLSSVRIRRPFQAAAIMLLVTVAGTSAQGAGSSRAHSHTQPHKATRWTQTGKASWYGRGFQGHRTASGEAFDLNILTCAHRTLPIGSVVRVTNLTNRRSIVVRVNDRGPIGEGRIVDLSYAAARALGFHGRGMMRVRLDKLEGAETAQLNWPELTQPPLVGATR